MQILFTQRRKPEILVHVLQTICRWNNKISYFRYSLWKSVLLLRVNVWRNTYKTLLFACFLCVAVNLLLQNISFSPLSFLPLFVFLLLPSYLFQYASKVFVVFLDLFRQMLLSTNFPMHYSHISLPFDAVSTDSVVDKPQIDNP